MHAWLIWQSAHKGQWLAEGAVVGGGELISGETARGPSTCHTMHVGVVGGWERCGVACLAGFEWFQPMQTARPAPSLTTSADLDTRENAPHPLTPYGGVPGLGGGWGL